MDVSPQDSIAIKGTSQEDDDKSSISAVAARSQPYLLNILKTINLFCQKELNESSQIVLSIF